MNPQFQHDIPTPLLHAGSLSWINDDDLAVCSKADSDKEGQRLIELIKQAKREGR